jgi:hypothetical protein
MSGIKMGKVGKARMVPSRRPMRKTAAGTVGNILFVCSGGAHGGKHSRDKDISRAATGAVRDDVNPWRT